MTKQKKQYGFMVLELVVFVAAVIIIGFIGYWALTKSKAETLTVQSGVEPTELQETNGGLSMAPTEIQNLNNAIDSVQTTSSASTSEKNMLANAKIEVNRNVTEQGDNVGKGNRIGEYQYYAGGSACYNKAWCAAFVSYMYQKSHTTNKDIIKSCSVSGMVSKAKNHSMYFKYSASTPKSGDILTWYGYKYNSVKKVYELKGHTGILVSISGSNWQTIEGNAGPANTKVKYVNRDVGYWKNASGTGATKDIVTGFIKP